MDTRRLKVEIKIAGQDVTIDLAPFLLGLTYTDNLTGEADSLELRLMDSKRLFISSWFPTLSDVLEAALVKENWSGSSRLPLGQFEIDEVECSYPPSIIKIKAVSISQNNALRQHDESAAYENARLSEIAQDVASKSGVLLFYDCPDDPIISRAEQGEQSRLAFLEKLCVDNGLLLKMDGGQIVICDIEKLEKNEVVMTFDRAETAIKQFSARATLQEVYKSCEVNYRHGQKAEQFTARYDSGKATGKTLKINKRVENQAEAERLAEKSLKKKNRDEIKVNLSVVGNFALSAGLTFSLKNFGVFDGKYLIDKATHTVGKGYETKIEAHKC